METFLNPVFIKGVLAVLVSGIIFAGSVWLLLGLVLGWKMGYLVTAATLFGILVLLSAIWFGTALGPKGSETVWKAASAGPDLRDFLHGDEKFSVSDYPGPAWKNPRKGLLMADGVAVAGQVEEIGPVAEELISEAQSKTTAAKEFVKGKVQGPIELEKGKLALLDYRFKEAKVEGKQSLIAVARAVPTEEGTVPESSVGDGEAEVVRWLVNPGEFVEAGQPLLEVKTKSGNITIPSTISAPVVKQGVLTGDRVKKDIAIVQFDVTGHPNQPNALEVAALRVRGNVRTPSLYWLIASLVLFILHLALLSRAEKSRKLQPVPA